MTKGFTASTILLSVLVSAPVSAATLLSLDRATFQASADSLSTQDFDALLAGSTLTYDGFVSYSTTGGVPQVTSAYLTSTAPNGLGATDVGFFQADDTLTLSFDSPVSAFALDINTFASTNGSYDVVLNNGDQAFSIFETFTGVGTGQFIGFTSDTPFTSLVFSANTVFPFTVDTLRYGQAGDVQIGAVPEPSTWAMMLLGFGFVGGAMRFTRRKQRHALSYS